MQKVLLVRVNADERKQESLHPVNYRPPYTLKYIQALLKQENDFCVHFIDAYAWVMSWGELTRATFSCDPDIVIISSTFLDMETTKKYISLIKQRNPRVIIIITGPGPSSSPDLYNRDDSIDFVLPGEAELEIYRLLKKINEDGSIGDLKEYYNGLHGNKTFIVEDPDGLPFVEYTKEEVVRYRMIYPLRMNKYARWGHILSSRGCPYGCIFCSPFTRDSYGRQLRLRSAKNIVDEIIYQLSSGINVISFDDDNFTTSRGHVVSICREISARGLRFAWIAHARVDNLDRGLMKLMRDSGCHFLRIGVESGSQRIINILKKTDEDDWAGRAKGVFEIAKELKMGTNSLFIIGNPTETREEIVRSIKLARALQPDILQVSFFTPFPGSNIYNDTGHNFALSEIMGMYHYSPGRRTNMSDLSNKDLAEMHKLFYRAFLFNLKFSLKHIFKYLIFYVLNFRVFLRLFVFGGYLLKRGNTCCVPYRVRA